MIAHGFGGSIVNVSSSSAFRAVSSAGADGVSKAGLGALTRAAASQLGPHGINVKHGRTRRDPHTHQTIGAFGDDTGLERAVCDTARWPTCCSVF